MFDYTEFAELGDELVTEFGRSITLIELNTTNNVDASKTWRAPAPRTTPTSSLTTHGVFVEPSSAQKLGLSADATEMLKRCHQIIIISSTLDLKKYNEIIDTDGSVWRITGIEQLQPGGTTLLYYFGVNR